MLFVYNGPLSGVTLCGGVEVMLFPGKEIDLPMENRHVMALVARKHLRPVSEDMHNLKNEITTESNAQNRKVSNSYKKSRRRS